MDRIIVKLQLTQEEVDRLMQLLALLPYDDDAIHIANRIYQQQYPE